MLGIEALVSMAAMSYFRKTQALFATCFLLDSYYFLALYMETLTNYTVSYPRIRFFSVNNTSHVL
jgi:hypothetical protein